MSSQANHSYYIPWHSIVPILPATSGPISPPDSELSPPLSAPPVPTVTSQVPAPVLDIGDDEGDPELMPGPTEDDDDVFESEPPEQPTNHGNNSNNSNNNATEVNNGSKRRSQSLSSLQTSKESAVKVLTLILECKMRYLLVFILEQREDQTSYERLYDIFEAAQSNGSQTTPESG